MRGPILIGLLVGGLLLLDIGQRIHMITLGYEIEQLKKNHQDFERAHKELLIERETLSSLDRVERIAIQTLGMIRPEAGQIIEVGTLPKGPSTPQGPQTIKVVRK